MNTQKLKSFLIKFLGRRPAAFIQALRFTYLLDKWTPDPEMQLAKRFLKSGDVAVDVGANGANWTYCLHKCVGSNGIVYAFEADPYYALATALAIKLKCMKGVHLFPFGLSDVDESRCLRVIDPNGLRTNGLGYIDRKDNKTEGEEIVQLKTLDSLIQNYPPMTGVSLIKLDVEGYELFVLRGAQEILTKARPIVILEVGNYERQGYSAVDVFDFFYAKEYVAYTMVDGGKLSPTGKMLDNSRAIGPNRVLVPTEKRELIYDLILENN